MKKSAQRSRRANKISVNGSPALAVAEEQKERAIDAGIQEGVKKQAALIEAKANKQAQEAASLDLQDLKTQLASEQKRREKAEKNELDMREREKAVEDARAGD